jgi:hypothetical protein
VKTILIPVLASALALSGCAGFTNAANSVAAGINTVSAAASSPAATQAVSNLKAGAQAILCDVGNVSAVATQVLTAVKAGKALIADTQTVYAASSIVCASLGGSVIASGVTVPTTATTTLP